MPLKSDLIAIFAETIADDDSHGYSQVNRTGTPDFDCSSLAIECAEYSGVPVKKYGASFTGNMVSSFVAAGFSKIKYSPAALLIRGDILLNEKYHAAIYIGNNFLVEASSDENGGITGKTPGDQTGHEIHRRIIYNYPWDWILRFTEDEPVIKPHYDPDCSYNNDIGVNVTAPQLIYKDYGPGVAAAQGCLNYHGFGPIEVNGFFSSRMVDSVKRFQIVHKLEVDGIIGPKTWNELLYWR